MRTLRLSVSVAIFPLLLWSSAAGAMNSTSYEQSACWDRIREARTSLNSTVSESRRDRMVDLIIDAERARSRLNYGACVKRAERAVRLSLVR